MQLPTTKTKMAKAKATMPLPTAKTGNSKSNVGYAMLNNNSNAGIQH